jgi:hypothetical protein
MVDSKHEHCHPTTRGNNDAFKRVPRYSVGAQPRTDQTQDVGSRRTDAWYSGGILHHIASEAMSIFILACVVVAEYIGLRTSGFRTFSDRIECSCGFLQRHSSDRNVICKFQATFQVGGMSPPGGSMLQISMKESGLVLFLRGRNKQRGWHERTVRVSESDPFP